TWNWRTGVVTRTRRGRARNRARDSGSGGPPRRSAPVVPVVVSSTAGLVPPQPGDVAPLTLRRAAGAPPPAVDGGLLDLRRRRWGLVNHRLGGDRRADPLAQRPDDDDRALLGPTRHLHPGPRADERRGLG